MFKYSGPIGSHAPCAIYVSEDEAEVDFLLEIEAFNTPRMTGGSWVTGELKVPENRRAAVVEHLMHPAHAPPALFQCPDCHANLLTRRALRDHSCPARLRPFHGSISPGISTLKGTAPNLAAIPPVIPPPDVASPTYLGPPETGLPCPACNHRTLLEDTVTCNEDVMIVRRCIRCSIRERI